MKWYLAGWKFWGEVFNMKQGAGVLPPVAFEEVGGYTSLFHGRGRGVLLALSGYAKRKRGRLRFVEHPEVITSPAGSTG